MSPWINYHHLLYFKTIAEEGSVSKAAAKLRLGQPTLSAQLKQFETNLGITLFDREHKRLTLTEQGKVALEYARNIFQLGSEMFEVLHDRVVPHKIALHLGSLDSVAKQVSVDLVKLAGKLAPCLTTLSEGNATDLLRELAAHRIDLLLTDFLPTTGELKGISHKRLTSNEVALYGAPSFRSLRKNFPESVSGAPLVLPTYQSRLRYDVEQWARTQGITLNLVIESQDVGVKKMLAIDGVGLMAAASHTVRRQLKAGDLIEIGPLKGVTEQLFLLSAHRKMKNHLADQLFSQFLL